MFDINFYGRVSKEDDLFFLKAFQNYSQNHEHISFKYENEPKNLSLFLPPELLSFSFDSDFYFMIRLMVWVHSNLIPGLEITNIEPFNFINILERTKKEKIESNCWMFATVLNELFLCLGFKSKMVRCMPMDLRFGDCHCVTQAFSKQLGKWVLFDPSFGTYYTNDKEEPINLSEFRRMVVKEQVIRTPLITAKKSKELLSYWVKNLFRFETYSVSKFNVESSIENKIIYSLIPLGFNISNKYIEKDGYWIKIIHTQNSKAFWEEETNEII